MKFFYRPFLFLLGWNALFLLLTLVVLELRFLIPVTLILLFFNLFLCFFTDYFIKKHYSFSHFPRDDFYGVYHLFEEFKKKNKDLKVQLLKSQELNFFYWSGSQGAVIVLSEDFLETFNKKELNCFFTYAFKKIRSGDLFFLSVLSSFLYLSLKPAFILSYPLFVKKRKKELVFLQKGLIGMLSLLTKPLFYKTDRELFKKSEQKREQALFLWNLESLIRLQNQKIPLFLSPLCLIDPHIGSHEGENQISLHPNVKNRLEKLTNTYPP